jgi:hypothetical protein
MIVADRLRALREEKKLSQGDIQERTGLLRCYVSRVENGHTVPAVETTSLPNGIPCSTAREPAPATGARRARKRAFCAN